MHRCMQHCYPPHHYALRPFGRLGSIMRVDRDPLPDRCYWKPCAKLSRLPHCTNQPSMRTKFSKTAILSWIAPRRSETGPRWDSWNAWAAQYAARYPHRCEP